MNEKKEEKTLAQRIGSLLGTVIVGCVAICLMAIAIALTAKFILWLI